MQRTCTPHFRPEFLVQNGRAGTSAGRAVCGDTLHTSVQDGSGGLCAERLRGLCDLERELRSRAHPPEPCSLPAEGIPGKQPRPQPVAPSALEPELARCSPCSHERKKIFPLLLNQTRFCSVGSSDPGPENFCWGSKESVTLHKCLIL